MIIKTWLFLSIAAVFVQFFLGFKTVSHLIGLIIPAAFLAFALYAWNDLSKVGIMPTTLLAFMIPPILLTATFELFYWKQRYQERKMLYEKNKNCSVNSIR